jgi:hypothetical protein
MFEERALRGEGEARVSGGQWGHAARALAALGELSAARQAYDRGAASAARSAGPDWGLMDLAAARYDLTIAVDEGWEEILAEAGSILQRNPVEYRFLSAALQVAAARMYARQGKADAALALLGTVVVALARAPAWAVAYAQTACDAAARENRGRGEQKQTMREC